MIILSINFLIFKYQLYNIYLTFYIKFLKEKTIVLALEFKITIQVFVFKQFY